MKLPVRLQTTLKRNGLTLFQAFRMTDEELLEIRNLGAGTLQAIRELQYGKSLTAHQAHERTEQHTPA